jgi:hypothetical protein
MIFDTIVTIKRITIALIQEPWYRREYISCGGRLIQSNIEYSHSGMEPHNIKKKKYIRGLKIPGYTLYSAGGTDRPRDCILVRNMTTWMLPGFSCRDLVGVLVKYTEDGAERRLVVCSAYLPYDSKDPPPSKEFEELMRYCENENLYLVMGCRSNALIVHGVEPTVMIEGSPW